ncbi:hypothetical protein [Aquidulcibacter sp.]|uniref:hypothetical protein n=1 Tax=Aquidulcibacter sp. TaxID=2052990 RepID=UPI0028AE1A41|nr:hypothetical protein [Aquidulcibacter sp.]
MAIDVWAGGRAIGAAATGLGVSKLDCGTGAGGTSDGEARGIPRAPERSVLKTVGVGGAALGCVGRKSTRPADGLDVGSSGIGRDAAIGGP